MMHQRIFFTYATCSMALIVKSLQYILCEEDNDFAEQSIENHN